MLFEISYPQAFPAVRPEFYFTVEEYFFASMKYPVFQF